MTCTNHPQVTRGLTRCVRCEQFFCADCLVEMDGRPACAACKTALTAEPEAAADARDAEPPPAGELPPWERRKEIGAFTAYIRTLGAVLGSPGEFFARMDKTQDRYDCLAIHAVQYTLERLVNFGAMLLWMPMYLEFLNDLLVQQGQSGFKLPMSTFVVSGAFEVLAAPAIALVMVFAWAGCTHLYLIATKNATHRYAQTMRGTAYAFCPWVVGVIPVLGVFVAIVWTMVVHVVMVRAVHRTGWLTAIIAGLWPVILCCSCLCCAYGSLAALVVAAK